MKHIWNNRLKATIALLALVSLASCGGGGGATNTNTSGSTSPSQVALVEVSSAGSSSIDVSWLPSSDSTTPASGMKYQIHTSTALTFTPSSGTLKAEGTGILSVRLTGLLAATRYTIVLVAINTAGRSSVSTPLTVTTSALNSETIPGVVVTTPQDVQIAAVTANQVTLAATATAPKVGQFIASTQGDGFLRQVTSVSTVSGQTVVQTQPASLNQVANNVEISSAFNMTSVPAEVAPIQAGVIVNSKPGKSDAEWQWPQTNFRLSSTPANRVSGTMQNTLQMGVASNGTGNIDVSTKRASKVGNWSTFTGPHTVGILAGTSGLVDLNLDVTKDDSAVLSGARIPVTICKVDVIPATDAPGLVSISTLTSSVTEMVGSYQAIRKATQAIAVNTTGVTPRAEPYVVRLRAYIDETENQCQGSFRFFLGWKEKLDIAINVAVVTTPNFPQAESKALDFTGGFNVHNDVTFTFDPRLEAEVKLHNTSRVKPGIDYARLEAKGRAELTQILTVTATGAATLDKTQPLIPTRKFVKVYMAGTVPIVMSGEFAADLRIQGDVNGALTATEEFKFSLEDMDYGVIYNNALPAGQKWSTVQNVRPTYELKLSGAGDAKATLTLSLVPRLSIKFYESASGRLAISPYVQADAGVHGQVLADITPAGITTDADYWLTQGQIAGGVDAYLMADLTVLDYTLVKWPSTANIADYTSYKKLTLLANTPIAGIPSLSAILDTTALHPTDSRAFLIKGRSVDVPNPLKVRFGGPDAFLPFSNWTTPKVIALNNTGYAFVPSPVGSDPGDAWFAFTNPGTYTVRLGGNSTMGGWARQVAEVVVDVTDSNNNGIIDQWEIKYGLLGSGVAIAVADPDADGWTNLQEFQKGLNPTLKDGNHPLPVYSGIDCGNPVAGQLMTCSVNGTDLPIDLVFAATGCANIQSLPFTATSNITQRQYTCTPANPGTLMLNLTSVFIGPAAGYSQGVNINATTCTPPLVLNQAGVCGTPDPQGTPTNISGTWLSNTLNVASVTQFSSLALTQNGSVITGTSRTTTSASWCGSLVTDANVTGSITGQLVTLNTTTTSVQQTCQGTGQWLGSSFTTEAPGTIDTIVANVSSNALIVTAGTTCSLASGANCMATYTDFSKQITARLNDTGITANQCFQTGGLVACNSAGALALTNAQDGMIGRDVEVATNSNTDGKLGFSFTAVPGGCVQDNNTGLMWEVKTTDGGLRDWSNTYTNFDSITAIQKWNGMAWAAPTQADIDAATNSIGFKNAVNAAGLCGFNDWRMPTADELQSIIDYGVAFPGPTIDANWIPNTRGANYWTSSPVVGPSTSTVAWLVGFDYGMTPAGQRSSGLYARLVRGGKPNITNRYSISADGQEVADNETNLIWRRCVEGMAFDGSTCVGVPVSVVLRAAMQLASAQSTSTGIGWRLPNVKELSSIADRSLGILAADTFVFPATPANRFWSSTPYVGVGNYGFGGNAWLVNPDGSVALWDIFYNLASVRLVRAGQ